MFSKIEYALRSLCFNVMFFLVVFFALAVGCVFNFITRSKYIFEFWYYLSVILNFISQKIMGINYTIENKENMINSPVIFAMRHESTWETLILIHNFKKPIFVLKQELLDIPLFGYLSREAGSIPVDRSNGARSLMDAARSVEQAVNSGHHVIIFPEGTRVRHGIHAELKRGISFFYKRTNCPVVPVVHNSGKFWPRHGFFKKSGNISVIICDPIQPGLSTQDFMQKLNDVFYDKVEKLKETCH